ncbi:MAG TPA: molybdopterin converting factor subunit 1 [Pyrinomonadaceae bacterium]
MKVKVMFFGGIRDIVGTSEGELEIPPGMTARDILQRYCRDYPRFNSYAASTMIAVNLDFASPETLINDGDEIAFIPPVSGG